MKSIFDHADYKQAQNQLDQLQQAHAAAVDQETALLAQINATPEGKPSALDRARAMLTGGTPAPRQDHAGLQGRLNECREKVELLALAIGEQRGAIAGLVQAHSAVINAEAKQGHIKAAERIKTALAGLRVALEAEQSIRAEIGAAGYLCTLEPIESHSMNFADSQSEIGRFTREANAYLMRCEIESKKTVTVRLLLDCAAGGADDVLSLPGVEAAALVHRAHAEVTDDKPGRKPLAQSIAEHVFS